jgi:hypothetical protein
LRAGQRDKCQGVVLIKADAGAIKEDAIRPGNDQARERSGQGTIRAESEIRADAIRVRGEMQRDGTKRTGAIKPGWGDCEARGPHLQMSSYTPNVVGASTHTTTTHRANPVELD